MTIFLDTVLGLCSGCRSTSNGYGIPLSMTADGKRLNVERLIGGCEIRHKFTAMGISIEDEIEIISN
ncbi:MAG: hypothetical protein ACUVQ2_01160 [Dissulfurimicrobium sp.]|uniref:hypothetical protein n=1 Tax=Dissulfurimicrobium sp. TaxID=2022436 RepID=UPI00404AE1A6